MEWVHIALLDIATKYIHTLTYKVVSLIYLSKATLKAVQSVTLGQCKSYS